MSNSYQARSLTASDNSVSAGTFSSRENWAVGVVGGGGGTDRDATGLSDSSAAESTSEAYCSSGEERPSPVGLLTVWYALSVKYSVSLVEGDLRSPRRLPRMTESFIRSRWSIE